MMSSSQERGAYRLAAILLQEIQPEDCRQCRDQLEAYCLAQLVSDQDALIAYQSTAAAHLDACADCAECYELLYTSMLPNAASVEPEQYPVAALRFLAPQPRANEQLRAALAEACEHYGERLRLTLSQGLLLLLPAAPRLALRSAQEQPLFELHASWPDQPLDGLHVQALPRSTTLADVYVHVHQSGRQWPDLWPLRVVLTVGSERYQAHSDPFGEALLAGVPLSGLEAAILDIELL